VCNGELENVYISDRAVLSVCKCVSVTKCECVTKLLINPTIRTRLISRVFHHTRHSVYVCMYVCAYVRMYVRLYVCIYTCLCIYVCMYGLPTDGWMAVWLYASLAPARLVEFYSHLVLCFTNTVRYRVNMIIPASNMGDLQIGPKIDILVFSETT
jgi:hypothetical protein